MTTAPRLGEVFADRFRLDKQLAELPGYTSYKAHDQEDDEEVELWLIREELVPTPDHCEQLVARAAALADLDHAHLRDVFDAGRAQSAAYVVVEPGEPSGLRRQISSGRPAPDNEIVLYATSIAEALEAAHVHGYVHGRLIPDDVVSVDGLIKVGGIGLFKDIDLRMARRLWRPVERYLAPEVRETGVLSRAADVYALAVIIVDLASGAGDLPIHEATQTVASETPALAEVLTPALSPSMRHRPISARELLRGIRQVLVDDKVPTSRRTAQQPSAELFGQNDTFVSKPRAATVDPSDGEPKQPFATTAAGMGEGLVPPKKKKKRVPTLVGISQEEIRRSAEQSAGLPRTTEPMGAQTFPQEEGEASEPAASEPAASEPAAPKPAASGPESAALESAEPGAEAPVVELPEPKMRRKRRTSHSPLADPGPGADPEAADEVVELLKAKGSLPPRFVRASAPPPVADKDDEDTGEVILLRASVDSESDEPTLRGDEIRRKIGGDLEGGPTTEEYLRSDTDSETPEFDDVDEEQETKVHKKAVDLSSELPLRARDTDDAVATVRAPRPLPVADLHAVRRPASLDEGAEVIPLVPKDKKEPRIGDDSRGSAVSKKQSQRTRESGGTTTKQRGPWLEVILGSALAVGLAFATWFALSTFEARRSGESGAAAVVDAAPSTASAAAEPAVVATPLLPECPTGMTAVAADKPFCIDIHESPGAGQLPELAVAFDKAEESCKARGARLCSSVEWTAACRGPNQSTYPYGVAFEADRCNVHKTHSRDIVATGSFNRCESASGAFDMSGNAGEWTVGRYVHGGSAKKPGLGRCPERRWVGPGEEIDDVGYRCCADP